MAQSSIGQERFGFAGRERAVSSLDTLVSLIDWSPVAALLEPLYPAAKGEPAWPPLAMFKAGTLVDATIIASASEDDDDARWVKHKGKRAVHGFKAHVGADADTALVEELSVTSANINDGKAGPEALPDNPGEVFADSAYRGSHFRDAVRAKRGIPRIVATGVWAKIEEEAQAWLHQ